MRTYVMSLVALVTLFSSFRTDAACQTGDTSSCVSLNAAAVVYVENGWFGEGLVIHLDANVGQSYATACATPKAAFWDIGLDKSHPSYKDVVGGIMVAYVLNKTTAQQVQLVIDSSKCAFGSRAWLVSLRLL